LLKELELLDAILSVKDLEAIVGGSPLLDALMLSDVYVLNNVLERCVIEAPNLRSLTIISVVIDGWQFGGLPRLDNTTIDLETYMYEGDFGQFLAGVAHASKLTLPTHSAYYRYILLYPISLLALNCDKSWYKTEGTALY
jgi:hypothetical protein